MFSKMKRTIPTSCKKYFLSTCLMAWQGKRHNYSRWLNSPEIVVKNTLYADKLGFALYVKCDSDDCEKPMSLF